MEDKLQPSFYANIPANVRYDKNICANAKLLYGEITALTNAKGYCWAGNKYFSDLYGVSSGTVSRWFKELEDNGYIIRELTYKDGTREIDKRYTRLNVGGMHENDRGYTQKDEYPMPKNVKDNNTSFNNTSNNTLNNKNNSSTTSNDEVSKQFETWWNTYGKKLAKPKALAAFKKVVKKHGYPKLLEQTMQYVEPFVKGQKDRQYQQHPQTFLNAYDPDNDYTPQKGGYQQNEGSKRADDFDSFKARTGVDAPF